MANATLIAYLVSFAAFMAPFTQTIYVPVLPELQEALETSQFLINASISVFTFVIAFMQILYGPLIDKLGRKKVLLPGLAIYTLASLGCFYSEHIYSLLFFRILQAVGIAAGSVVAVTVIGDIFQGKSRAKAMGTFQMMTALGPVVGPVAGGFIAGNLDFHFVFLVLSLIGAGVFLLNLALLKETKPDTAAPKLRLSDYHSILTNKRGSTISVLGFIQFYIYYNFLVYLPVILTDFYELTVEQKGLLFLPLSLSIVAGSFLSSRVQDRLPAGNLLFLTAILSFADIIFFMLTATVSLPLLVISTSLFGLLLGLSLPAQMTLLTEVFIDNRGTAIGLYNFFRFMGMASGPMIGTLLFSLGGISVVFGFAAALFLFITLLASRNLKQPVRAH